MALDVGENGPEDSRSHAGSVQNAKLVLGGIAPAPIEITEAGAALIGQPLDDEHIAAAAEAAYIKARPLDNTDFVMNWRKQMTREYSLRALKSLQAEN